MKDNMKANILLGAAMTTGVLLMKPSRCPKRLILLSNQVKEADLFANSVRKNTVVMRYGPEDTLLTCQTRLRDMGIRPGSLENIGWVAHKIDNLFGTRLRQARTISGKDTFGTDLLIEIIHNLKVYLRPNRVRIDLLACCLAIDPGFPAFAKMFRDTCGVELAASTDLTGNDGGANWVLETHGVDSKAIYFTDKILEYRGYLMLSPSFGIDC
jgi:hypothetical protein